MSEISLIRPYANHTRENKIMIYLLKNVILEEVWKEDKQSPKRGDLTPIFIFVPSSSNALFRVIVVKNTLTSINYWTLIAKSDPLFDVAPAQKLLTGVQMIHNGLSWTSLSSVSMMGHTTEDDGISRGNDEQLFRIVFAIDQLLAPVLWHKSPLFFALFIRSSVTIKQISKPYNNITLRQKNRLGTIQPRRAFDCTDRHVTSTISIIFGCLPVLDGLDNLCIFLGGWRLKYTNTLSF